VERFLISGAPFLLRLRNAAQVVSVSSGNKPKLGCGGLATKADTPLWVHGYGFHSGKLPQLDELSRRRRRGFRGDQPPAMFCQPFGLGRDRNSFGISQTIPKA